MNEFVTVILTGLGIIAGFGAVLAFGSLLMWAGGQFARHLPRTATVASVVFWVLVAAFIFGGCAYYGVGS